MLTRWGFVAVAALAVTLTGCGGSEKQDNPPPTTEASTAPSAAPATPEPLMVKATWTGEGAARKAQVSCGAEVCGEIDPAAPAASDALIACMKAKREAMVAAGQPTKCVIEVAPDMPLDGVGKPLLQAALKAGFRFPKDDPASREIEYKKAQ